MTALKAHEVARYLDRPDLGEGVFLAYGPDNGLVRETAQRLVFHLTGGDLSAVVVLDGGEIDTDPGRLLVEAGTQSLFGGRRVVRVRGAGKSAVTPLAELKDAPGGAAVVLEAGNLTPRDPLRAMVEGAKFGRALPCYPDTAESLQKVILETFAAAGIAVDPDVAPTLRDTLGNDREVTRRELEKLVLFAGSTRHLSREDVLALCADNAALAIDEIVLAAGSGDAARLSDALARAEAAAVSPQQVLFAAGSHFSQLRRWRIAVDAGRSARDVLESSRPRPHFSKKAALEQQLRIWGDTALAAASERLHQASTDSRRTHALANTHVGRALLAICQMAVSH